MFKRIASLLAASAVVASMAIQVGGLSVASASAPAPAAYRTTILAPAPSSTFTFSGGGDGWDLAFSKTQFFNIYHHSSNSLTLDCHLKIDGSTCAGFPKNIQDGTSAGFSTAGHPSIAYDSTRHVMYSFTMRGDGHVGVLCMDPSTTSSYCGFTDYGTDGVSSTMSLSNGVVVGTNYYAYDYVNPGYDSGTVGRKILCFNLSTADACTTPTYNVTVGAIDFPYPYPAIAEVGGLVVISTGSNNPYSCFSPALGTDCTGTWPRSVGAGSQGAPVMPALSSTGVPNGFCIPGSSECYDLQGNSLNVPSAITSSVKGTTGWQGTSLIRGTRVYTPIGGYDEVDCVDFATGTNCPNYPFNVGSTGTNYLYTLGWDPGSPGCVWVSADGGSHKVTNFDGLTTGPCGASSAEIASSQVLAPSPLCQDVTWQTIRMQDAKGGSFSGGTATITDSSGNAISGIDPFTFGSDGVVDVSAIGGLVPPSPKFQVSVADPVGVSLLQIEFDWTGDPNAVCRSAPNPPSGVKGNATPGSKTATVSWIPPDNTGIVAGGGSGTGLVYVVSLKNASGTVIGSCRTSALTCTFVTLETITAGAALSADVTAKSSSGSAKGSGVVLAYGPPAAPTKVTAVGGFHSIVVTYLASANTGGRSVCCSYDLVYSSDGGTSWTSANINDFQWFQAGNQTVYQEVLSGLDPALTYQVKVRSTNKDDMWVAYQSADSTTLSAQPVGDLVVAPNVTAIKSSSTFNISLSSNDRGNIPVIGYEVLVTDVNGQTVGSCSVRGPVAGAALEAGSCQISDPGTFTGPFTVSAMATNGVNTSSAATALVEQPISVTVLKNTTVGANVNVKAGSKLATLLSGALPPGLWMNAFGLITGTPTVAAKQPYTFSVNTTAAGSSTTTYFSILVGPAILKVLPPPAALFVIGQEVSPTNIFTVSDATAPSLTWSVTSGSLPAGMSLTADGVLAGTPSEVGVFPITVKAVDSFTGSSYSGTGSYSVVVGADNGSGQFTIPPTNWAKAGKGLVQPDGSFLLTPSTQNIAGALSMPFAFNVSDFTVEANIDFGTSKGDGVAIAFLDPASTKRLGGGGLGMGILGLTGTAVVFDQHKNTETSDPSGNFVGVSQQPSTLKSYYSATSALPTTGSTNLLGVHAVSIHIQQSGGQWLITVGLDGAQKLQTNVPLSAITSSAILSFIGSNGVSAGVHSVANVSVTTPERAPACLATNTTQGTLSASLQAAVDNASWDDNIVITGVCDATTINNGQIHLTGRGANASISGGLNIGSAGGTVYLRGLHLQGASHAGMTGHGTAIEATNVIFENGLTGIEMLSGS
ncbi:MAG: putative Ig domain-containing protein, partial [Actinomycetota bacterium]